MTALPNLHAMLITSCSERTFMVLFQGRLLARSRWDWQKDHRSQTEWPLLVDGLLRKTVLECAIAHGSLPKALEWTVRVSAYLAKN